MFAVPEIAVTDDETRNRLGKRHPASLQLGVEMREAVRHLGPAHGLNPLLGKLGREAGAPVAALQALPFLGGHDDERVAPVLGDDNRFMPGLIAECAEGLLEFAGSDASRLHGSI